MKWYVIILHYFQIICFVKWPRNFIAHCNCELSCKIYCDTGADENQQQTLLAQFSLVLFAKICMCVECMQSANGWCARQVSASMCRL